MSIGTYTDGIIVVHMVLFFCLIVAGIAAVWRRIRKKKIRHWWLIPKVIGTPVMLILTAVISMLAIGFIWSFILIVF